MSIQSDKKKSSEITNTQMGYDRIAKRADIHYKTLPIAVQPYIKSIKDAIDKAMKKTRFDTKWVLPNQNITTDPNAKRNADIIVEYLEAEDLDAYIVFECPSLECTRNNCMCDLSDKKYLIIIKWSKKI
jgi:hypothetical protein